jgi:hypothetical protein
LGDEADFGNKLISNLKSGTKTMDRSNRLLKILSLDGTILSERQYPYGELALMVHQYSTSYYQNRMATGNGG